MNQNDRNGEYGANDDDDDDDDDDDIMVVVVMMMMMMNDTMTINRTNISGIMIIMINNTIVRQTTSKVYNRYY